MSLVSGTRLGPYEIVSPIGAGGMGEVYKARDSRLARDVAVKVVSGRLSEDPKALARFEREARAVAALNHPNILSIFDYGHEGDITYAVMELLEGETLQQHLARGPLPVSKAVEVAKQIAKGLAAAHAKSVVHRDLKPGNVFLTEDGNVKILDFGLARREAPVAFEAGGLSQEATADAPTGRGIVLGTLGYMSPEQARGLPADARSDLFAFGVVLYEMLSGKRAFEGDTASDTLAAILMKDPDPLPPVTPPGLGRVVRRCLEKRPEDRFQSAHDVALALETASATGGSDILEPPSEGWPRRHWMAVIAAAGSAVVVLAAVLLALDAGGLRSKWFGAASKTVSIRSLAVLPLANVSGDAAQEYFSDGMTDELITHLSKISALKVISRTSVMQFKDTRKSLKEIAHELDVDGIIEGSVLRSGDRVRITAQLIDASTDTHVWAESYERDLKDVLTLQGEVARTIAGAVNVALTPQDRDRLSGARRVNPEAYEACLKGNSYWMKLTAKDTEAALPYFERAIEIDPECVQAYRGLAWYWIVRMQMGRSAPGDAGPKAKGAALRAIALDEGCAEAHEALAAVRTGVDWDWTGAEREWRRALEINPGASNGHAYYADFLATLGRVDEALPHIERAIELDPSNALFRGIYAMVLVYARRYDDALAASERALALQPDMAPARSARRSVYGIRGMREEQLAEQRRQISYDPERLAAFEKGLAEGGYEGAQLAIADLWTKRVETGSAGSGKGILPAFQVCSIAERYLDAHEDVRALNWLEKAYDARDPALRYQIRSPVWDRLHSDSRFQALARRMNIPLGDSN